MSLRSDGHASDSCISVLAMIPNDDSGILTILFTDIEGSTSLWEQDSDRMRLALARHDAILHRAVESNHGTVVKMTGDGMCAAFDAPLEAVAATLELQRALSDPEGTNGIPLQVRCGLHLGVVERRDNDLFGTPVNRAARIMAAAYGGQVLLSEAVASTIGDRLPSDISLRDLGSVRLRGLANAEHVFQMMHPKLREAFPALRSLESTPHNLPEQLTSFVGREKEIAEVEALLGKTRLLTLTGSGGCGKTRLSLRVAADLLEAFPDGVWLVELASLADADHVPQAVATVLGLKEERGKSLMQTLTEHLKSRHLLMVLDNAEHLLAVCAELADTALRQCPKVTLLVSSREGLGTAGELTYRVPSLSVPHAKHEPTPERLTQYESVRLFLERVQLHLPQFTITRENAPALASICYRLDGIPLALELAAARVRSLSVEEVNRRLDQRFRLLTGGSRTALPRQQTLRSLIDWSYDLLRASEQALFCRTAVFAGGWTLASAEHVCRGERIDEGDVLDLITSLVDKNLVVPEERDGSTRYRLLETIRQYARDRLLETGDGGWLRNQHLAYFLAFVDAAEPQLSGPDQQTWLDRLEVEHDNLRSALAWSASAGGDAATGLRLASALWRFWYVRGYWTEGRRWLSALLAADPGGHALVRAKALNGAGALAWQQADNSAARVLHAEGLALFRELGDRQGIARSLGNLGNVAHGLCDYATARALIEESLAMRRVLGDRQGTADALNNLGALAYEQCDHVAASALYEECLAILRELGNPWGTAIALTNLGAIADSQGEYAKCRMLYHEGLAIFRELGDRGGIPTVLNNLGDVAYAEGDYAAARALYDESLTIRREVGDQRGVASQLNNLGKVASAQCDYLSARPLHEEAAEISSEISDHRCMAVALEGLAIVALGSAQQRRAALLWGAAEKLREEIGYPLAPKDRAAFSGRVAVACAALGNDVAFSAAWEEGRAMALQQVLEHAVQR